MKILLVEPNRQPVVREIDGSLESMQQVVGGLIEAIYPFEDAVALVCNEEGKLCGLPYNRALRDRDGHVYDVVAGTFFLCGAPPDSDRFTDLTEEQIETYTRIYEKPECFLSNGVRVLLVRERGC